MRVFWSSKFPLSHTLSLKIRAQQGKTGSFSDVETLLTQSFESAEDCSAGSMMGTWPPACH